MTDNIQQTSSAINASNVSGETHTNEIKIHQISRDTFIEFLKTPTHELLDENTRYTGVYPKDGQYHITSSFTRFYVGEELIDFLGNPLKVAEYLSENNFSTEIENMALLDAPNMSRVVWVKTSTENIYITVNESPEDNDYVYRIYSEFDFNQKYAPKECRLIVFGKEINEHNSILYHNYADVSLIPILEALGAKVEKKSNEKILIDFNNKNYTLNISERQMVEIGNENIDLFKTLDGGCFFIYEKDNEMIVDTTVLYNVLSDMGIETLINIDLENNAVIITEK